MKMNDNYAYAIEKLRHAVRCLCTSGDQKSRLDRAVSALTILCIHPRDFLTDDIQPKLDEFYEKMTSVEAIGDEVAVSATVNSLDEDAINMAVNEIIDFYETVCCLQVPS